MTKATTYIHVTCDPDVCGGLACVEGTRVRVLDIVALHLRGRSSVEILDSYEHLTLGQIHAALTYYYDHQAEVDAQLASSLKREAEFRRNHPDLAH